MITIKRIVPFTLVTLLAGGLAAGVAHAATSDTEQDKQDVAALAAMKVTLPQAIATAEKSAGGRAVGADVTQASGTPQIAVEVAGPQGAKTVVVDGQTGQVVATKASGEDAESND